MLNIKIKYHDKNMPKLKLIDCGDWIDLRVAGITNLESHRFDENKQAWRIYEGEVVAVSFGISVLLPKKYEAIIAPRSSLFLKHGLILTNSPGLIDNSYCGDDDIWRGVFFKVYNSPGKPIFTYLKKYERIAQFRIQKNMPRHRIQLVEVSHIGRPPRGSYGSSGEL